MSFHCYGRGSYMPCKLINTWHVYTLCMSSTLNRSSALQHFECGSTIEICNAIMFDFYPGLPHIWLVWLYEWYCNLLWQWGQKRGLEGGEGWVAEGRWKGDAKGEDRNEWGICLYGCMCQSLGGREKGELATKHYISCLCTEVLGLCAYVSFQ